MLRNAITTILLLVLFWGIGVRGFVLYERHSGNPVPYWIAASILIPFIVFFARRTTYQIMGVRSDQHSDAS